MSHQEEHLKSSQFISDIVIGLTDGLTVPFALTAGLSGAVHSNLLITTAGMAEIIAGSIAMGLGGYLSGKTAEEHYAAELKREYLEVETIPEKEKDEIRQVFAEYGLSKTIQDEIADELSQNKEQWVHFMMRYELGLEEPQKNRASKAAATIGLSYVAGGANTLASLFHFRPATRRLYVFRRHYHFLLVRVWLFQKQNN